MKQIGKNAVGVQGDVSKLEDLDRLYTEIKAQGANIDILFANAGGGEFAPLVFGLPRSTLIRRSALMRKGLLFTVKTLPLFNDGGSIILNARSLVPKALEHSVSTARPKRRAIVCPYLTVDLAATSHLELTQISPGRSTP